MSPRDTVGGSTAGNAMCQTAVVNSERRKSVHRYQRKSEPLPDVARSWVDTGPDFDVPRPESAQEVLELSKDYLPTKFGSALYSKLNREKKYWELDHVAGHPFVLAVHDYPSRISILVSAPIPSIAMNMLGCLPRR